VTDTRTRDTLDTVAALAARLCRAPAAVLSLSDGEGRQTIVTAAGVDPRLPGLRELCERTAAGPSGRLVTACSTAGESLRAFAGIPVRAAAGTALGTLAVLDADSGRFCSDRLERLEQMARHTALVVEACRAAGTGIGTGLSADAAQQRLIESEYRFRQVVEQVTDVLFEQDTEGRWTFLNPAWSDITGFEVNDCLGRHYYDFIHPDDAAGSRNRFAQMLAGGGHTGIHAVRYVTADGDFRWIEARARRLCNDDGTPRGTIGTLRDVTMQRAMADEIDRSHRHAVMSFGRISEFLANVSHEIRTPLNGVLGLTTILLDTMLSDEQRQYASGVHQSADTLLALVNDILDISKIEAGGLTIEQVSFAIRPWLDEVLAPSFGRARKKGLHTQLTVSDEMPARLIADPTRTRQILGNLMDNAVKFTASGAITVSVTPHINAMGRRTARFVVQDSGIGIPASQHGAVFEKYRQADSSTTRRYGGTGLGLAICRQLATLMEGEIGLESVDGEGTSFWFTIPLAAAPDAEDAPAPQRPAPPVAEVPRTPLVLIAEDNPTNQLVARRFLEKEGCRVELVTNGAEAVTAAAAQRFDVIFMDCQMPLMDGYEATRQIRLGPSSADAPIVAMTAHAMTGDRERCLAAGMSDYVSKPLTRAQIGSVLARVLLHP
jgi:PAS domain S-box-containing protein